MMPWVYSLATGLIRHWTLPANAAEEAIIEKNPPALQPGEGIWWTEVRDYAHYRVMQERLNLITGLSPRVGVDDRHVVVETATGIAKAVCFADPTIDGIPGHALVQHDEADVTWPYDPKTKTFARPAAMAQIKQVS